MKRTSILLFILLLCPIVMMAQKLKLSEVFSDNMTLQGGVKIPVYGSAPPNSRVIVKLHKRTKTTIADNYGRWMLYMPELYGASNGTTLTAICNQDTVLIKDINVSNIWAEYTANEFTKAPFMSFMYRNEKATSNEKRKITIFSIGDSTMANRSEDTEEAGWGQMLHEHLTDEIAVDNHAKSGRSSKSFITEGRWKKVVELLQPGDYVFIQFGHNDEKSDTTRYTDPNTSFKDNLRKFITEAQDKGAIPVLFNAMVRRKFADDGKLTNTHGEYIKTPFDVAEEMSIPYVDAAEISKQLVESMGPEESKKLFMWFPPKKQDDTHLNKQGARVMSGLFLNAAAEVLPSLKQYLKKN